MTIPRFLLDKYFKDPRMIRAMEDQSASLVDTVAATEALQDATVIVLSSNGDFTNERVLEVGDNIEMEITDSTVRLSVKEVAFTPGFTVTLLAQADTELILPVEGSLVSSKAPQFDVASLGAYVNDAAAAAGGVPVGGVYRNSAATSQLMIRIA